MADPLERRLIEAFTARLREIRVTNGYRTDAGQRVHLGVPALGPDDPEVAVAVLIGDPMSTGGGHKLVALPLTAAVVTRASRSDPLRADQDVVADIKRAIEGGDATFGGLAKSLDRGEPDRESEPRVAGSTRVGAQVAYVVRYVEAWGNPEG